MNIQLALNFLRNGHIEASRHIGANSQALLPIPIPNVGEFIFLEVDGKLYQGVVSEKTIDLTQLNDTKEGFVTISLFIEEKAQS